MKIIDLKSKLAVVAGGVAAGAATAPAWRRRAAWSLGGLLLLWALAWAAVPPIVKSQLEKIASEKLGRQVTLGAVDFKPWSLELTLNDLAIAKRGPAAASAAPAAAQFTLKRLYIDAELSSLLRLAPVVDAISMEAPVLSLTHLGQGRYDIDDLLARLRSPDDGPASEPPRFALYNLVLSGGQIDFVDQPVGQTHALRALHLSVPFLSNLASQREVKIAPHLAFTLNGSRFDSAAEGTPFARTRKTDATLKFSRLDLSPYLAYWPSGLPVRLQAAMLQADLKLAFEQTPASVVRLSGSVSADQVRALDTHSPARELLAFERLQVQLDDVRPLAQFVKLSQVTLTAPTLNLTRDPAGRLNLLPPAVQGGQGAHDAPEKIAADADSVRAGGQKDPKTPATAATAAPAGASPPWKIQIASATVQGGRLNWRDETLASPAQIGLKDLALQASSIAMPFVASAPLQFKGSLGLDPGSTAAAGAPTLLSFSGSATDQAAQLNASASAWPLKLAAQYVGQFLLPALGGQLDAEFAVNWQAARPDQPQSLQITAPQLALREVQLAQGKHSLVSIRQVDLSSMAIDLPGQTFKAGKLLLTQPKALVERGADKRWMYERWMVAQGQTSKPAAPPPTTAASRASAPSWAVAIDEVQFEGGALSFSDKAVGPGSKPVVFEITAARAQLGGLLLDDRPAAKAQAAKAMPLSASLKLASGRSEPGQLDFKGSLGLAPQLQAQGRLVFERLPVQAFEPYFADTLNIELLRADASFRGQVAWRQSAAGPQARVAGDGALEAFKANTTGRALAPSEELLAWKALNLRGLSVALEPAKATQVGVKETVLTDFFARVIVMPDGRINLQDLLKPAAGPAGASATALPGAPDATKTIAVSAQNTGAGGQNDPEKTVQAVPPAQAAPSASPAPVISFGPMTLVNGKVLFSDRFIKPNYSANLSELTGKLGAFSSLAPASGPPAMADLELRGKAEGTASLEILGKLNPLAKPLALDITGKVRDLELPPLSPYAIKYAGYGINRGKLSVDVNYVVLPDGRLTASNKLVLNQLSFGDKVEGASASLPVKLAVALLADRNGVIDLDLPISGSLNDPQFSLGPVIVKVILNVIVKAITAPFSLLAGALGGGGEELSSVSFAPGSARLAPAATAGLDKVAKALLDRPALRLTVVGTSNLDAEREGFKRERLDELVRAEKRRGAVKEGGASAITAAVSISPADYPGLLKEVYKRADLPKPRNLIGLVKELPVAEMEALLLADIKVSEDAMRELALQRGVAVKDYLAGKSLPAERLFLGAAKAVPAEAKWTPRAELNLAMP